MSEYQTIERSKYIKAKKDGDHWVLKNTRGLEVNGNRTIHTKNWSISDLIKVVWFLQGKME